MIMNINTKELRIMRKIIIKKLINKPKKVEQTFSNLLYSLLENKTVMKRFAKAVLKLNRFDENNYSIIKQKNKIDLFIKSSNHYFVIENKICSNLIKENKRIDRTLKKYFKKDKDMLNEFLDKFKTKDYYYHTDKYFAYASSNANEQALVTGYVLFPNYAIENIAMALNDTIFKKHFSLITCFQVFDFFNKIKTENWLNEKEKIYLDEFLKAMEKHTRENEHAICT